MYQEIASVVLNQEVMPGVFVMWVNSPDMASHSQPGQFIMVSTDYGYTRILKRPLSVHQVTESNIAFLYAAVGEGTGWLSGIKESRKIDLLGPLGNGYSVNAQSKNLLLAAGGMGIAPLGFLAKTSLKKGLSVRMLIGAKTAALICPKMLIPDGAETITVTEDGTSGEKGLVTDLVSQHAAWADQIFICGPLPMYKALAQNSKKYFKGKPTQASLEVRMGCGMGFCYACTIKTRQGLKQVCKDGPVFNMEDVIWEEMK